MTTTGTRPIVAVEDDRFFREALDFILCSRGYACRTAADALEARQILSRTEASAAIVDLGLPGENGLELAKWILETKPHTPVLIVTGTADGETVRAAFLSGVAGYLVKPVTPEELIDAVDHAIGTHRTTA